MPSRRFIVRGALLLGVVMVGVLILYLLLWNEKQTDGKQRLVFAEDSRNFWTAPTIVAREHGLFDREGLDVEVVDFSSGLACKNAVLTSSADIGIVGTTPVAVGGFQNERVVLLGSYVQSNRIVKLVARNGGGAVSPDFLVGRKVGVVPGTSSEITYDRLVDKYRLDRGQITRASFRPTELVPALSRGDIDAFVCWEPLPLIAARDPGVATFSDPELYTQTLYLVSRPDVVEAKRDALCRFLRAVDAAIRWIEENPDAARKLVEEKVGLRPGELEPIWPALVFSLRCNPGVIIEDLRREGQWARAAGLVKGEVPDYTGAVDVSVCRDFQHRAGR